jgi:hypothetical protein
MAAYTGRLDSPAVRGFSRRTSYRNRNSPKAPAPALFAYTSIVVEVLP